MQLRRWVVGFAVGLVACGGGGGDSSDVTDDAPCTSSAECAGDPGGPVCDVALGACVACTTAEDVCAQGSRCVDDACVPGCTEDADCSASTVCDVVAGVCVACVADADCADGTVCDAQACRPGCRDGVECPGQVCDPTARVCVDCLTDGDCPASSVCAPSQVCVPGCTDLHPCGDGLGCCDGACTDLLTDAAHCQTCDTACAEPPNAAAICDVGMCGMGACADGWLNCDGDTGNGCEHDGALLGPCVCTPGASEACYDGSPETLGVGVCVAGTHVCEPSGAAWGTCDGQVTPVMEVCGDGIDDDCSGVADDPPDADGDGWTPCAGDCDDANPLVNPGAFELAGNGLDDDCDGNADNTLSTACSFTAKFTALTGANQAAALDLCQTTTANPPLSLRKWGLVSAALVHANGTTPSGASSTEIQNYQASVNTLFGNSMAPRANATLAGLSTGRSRDVSDPGWQVQASGTLLTSAISFPSVGPLADYLNAHGGTLVPGTCGGNACPVGTGANDSVALKLQLRVPTNAVGFSYDFRLLFADYQTFQCTSYNDYYLASLDSSAAGLPADHVISSDVTGGGITVNSPFVTVCGGNAKNCSVCSDGTAALDGTGFDFINGAATPWLTTDAPVVPGEIITIYFSLFDVNDHTFDTQVLLDNFRWRFSPVTVATYVAS